MNALLRSSLVSVAVSLACLGPGCESQNADDAGNIDSKESLASPNGPEPTGDLLTRVKWLIARTTDEDYEISDGAEKNSRACSPMPPVLC